MNFQERSEAISRVGKPQKVSWVLKEEKKIHTENQQKALKISREIDEVYVI